MRYLISCWLLLGALSPLTGQSLTFDFLDTRDGLAAEVSTTVLQDSRNLIWVGTQSGLQTYDGYELKDVRTTGVQGSPGIKALAEDSVHDIWVATAASGLRQYERQNGKWRQFDQKSPATQRLNGPGITHLEVSPEGLIWVGTPHGLYRINREDSIRIDLCLIPFDSLSDIPQKVTAMGLGPHGELWVAIDKMGLAIWRANSDRVEGGNWELIQYKDFPFLDGSVRRFYADRQQNFWVLTKAGPILFSQIPQTTPSLVRLDALSSLPGFAFVYRYPGQLFDALSPAKRFVHDMVQQENGDYLFLHMYGMFRVDQSLNHMEFISLAELGIPSKGFNLPLNFYQDKQGSLWIPTMEGLARPADKSSAFHAYRPTDPTQKIMVRAMLEDQAGQKWMGVEDGGIYIFDQGADTPYLHLFLNANFPGHNPHFIMSLREIDQNTFWVGTYRGGLNKLTVSRDDGGRIISWTNEVYLHGKGNGEKDMIYVYDILEDTLTGTTWVGEFDGLCRIDSEKGFTRFPLPVANVLWRQASGDMLVGTDRGLFKWFQAEDSVRAFDVGSWGNFSSYRIEALVAHADTLWVGTIKGLFAVDLGRNEIVRFDETDGLAHQSIRGLLVDENKTLWVSTLNGLCRKRGGRFESFTADQGIQNNLFISRALYQTSSGQILAGGDNGMVGFRPEELDDMALQGIHIADFQLFGQSVNPGEHTRTDFQLRRPVNELRHLTLTHRERMIGFRFAALGYRQADHYRYAYRLQGFDSTWKQAEPNQRLATFTNLAPGDYILEIQAAGPTGPWQVSRKLAITVLAPWWRRWWAWALYLCLAGSLIWWAWTQRLAALRREIVVKRRITAARQAEREKVRAESARDFHDEAGAQLTKLMLYSNLLRSDSHTQPKGTIIDQIQQNIQGLSDTMRDFIWMLDSRQDSLSDTLLRIRQLGENLFEPSDIEFKFKGKTQFDEDIPLQPGLRRHLVLICKEALHNALKYASGHTVTLKAEFNTDEERLFVQIIDDGIGFQADNLGRINGLKNMESRAKEIGADFDLQSTPGMGTAISLHLPIHPNGG